MKTKLIIALLLACSTVFAQNTDEKFKIPKNKWVLGGSLNFNYSDSEDLASENQNLIYESKSNSLGINPDFGYLITDNLVMGLKSGFSFGSSEFSGTTGAFLERDFELLSISPYIRKYFPLGSKFAFTLEGGATFYKRWDNSADSSNNDISKRNTTSLFIGVTPGMSYSLSKKVYLYSNLGSLGYNYTQWETIDGSKSKNNSFSLNLFTTNLNFGVLVVL